MDATTIVLVGLAGALLLWPLVRRTLSPVPGLAPDDLKRRLDRGEPLVLVDVRAPEEVRGGRIAGALNVPLPELGKRIGEVKRAAEASPDAGVVVVCQSDMRARAAMPTLAGAGLGKVAVLTGGMSAWTREGLPVERGG